MSYEEEFRIFSNNVNQAARSFHYHCEIKKQIHEDGIHHEKMGGYFQDSKIFQAINENAQFWSDYIYSSISNTIIILGRIFDRNKNSHGIERLISQARVSALFTKEELRIRKVSGSDNANEWIDNYMANIRDFERSEYSSFLRYIVKTKKLWSDIKKVRNKLYAHQAVINLATKTSILEKATYASIGEILSRLLVIEHIFFEAFHNGYPPNYDFENSDILKRAQEDIRTLLQKITK